MSKEIETLKTNYKEEQQLRKTYYNQLEDLKGSIRVFVRTRPFSSEEVAAKHKNSISYGDGEFYSSLMR